MPNIVRVLGTEVYVSGLGIVSPFIFVGSCLLYGLTHIIGEYLS